MDDPVGEAWCVVGPDELLEPYDETLVGKPTAVKRAWARRVLSELQETFGDLRDIEFEIHAGADYWNFGLGQGLEAAGARIEIPTKGMAQGQQLAFYKRAAGSVSKDS